MVRPALPQMKQRWRSTGKLLINSTCNGLLRSGSLALREPNGWHSSGRMIRGLFSGSREGCWPDYARVTVLRIKLAISQAVFPL